MPENFGKIKKIFKILQNIVKFLNFFFKVLQNAGKLQENFQKVLRF